MGGENRAQIARYQIFKDKIVVGRAPRPPFGTGSEFCVTLIIAGETGSKTPPLRRTAPPPSWNPKSATVYIDK